MTDILAFIHARLEDRPLPPAVDQTYRSILGLCDTITHDGEADDWVSWLTGSSEELKWGEYLLGLDPASRAARLSERLRATLARTWADHPDYDGAWSARVPDPSS